MIASFKHKGLKRLYEVGDQKLLPPDQVARIATLLAYLDAAATLEDLNIPSLRLHPLKGRLEGFSAINVRANWRIVFRFNNGMATDVELLD